MNPPDSRPTTKRAFVASVLGVVGGAGAIGGMWLPLANLGGLGPVGFFDYNRARVYACIAVAGITAVFSFARCFRIVLLTTGTLCGLLSATGIDLYQALREVMTMNGSDLAQMAQTMVAHSSLQAGAYVVPLCALACIVAGALGSVPVRPPPEATSGS